ncbi:MULTISPECIES: hypothetical protein [Desertifilum]|uniref:Uncharacterized protein n=1 Tax=Desertifilum tharense IPPAS B-1220 TaxID=1781255 RepID=A0A1E5QE49_9CYAN|nr:MULTISPECIES: hypothetical protein [Desertifilum]MDA0211443.1 hypothetical protein [Cyanobacteria bacterium FC1]OEJ72939.1 hypothetical protein BH720_22405 [Desertifilum tharense IPPAS B-1220]
MNKLGWVTFGSLLCILGIPIAPVSSMAQTCASNCGPRPIQFIPGQVINFQVINRTASLVLIQRPQETGTVPLRPGQLLEVRGWSGTTPNLSIVFWDETALSLKADILKLDDHTLRVELRPGGPPPGDRTLYIENDGRVRVF